MTGHEFMGIRSPVATSAFVTHVGFCFGGAFGNAGFEAEVVWRDGELFMCTVFRDEGGLAVSGVCL